MFSPKRITLYILLFIFLVFGFFHYTLPLSSLFYQVTPPARQDSVGVGGEPTLTPPESTKQAKTIILPTDLPTATPSETPVIVSPPSPDPITYYTVQTGDTLTGIANNFGVSWIDLANLNKISNPNMLVVGQVIKISTNQEDYKNIDPYYVDQIYQAEENEKHILIVLSEQMLYTYEGDKRIKGYLISSGTANFPTVTGVFKIWIKLETTSMSGEGYSIPKVPYTMYFYGDYAVHGADWHNNFGTPMSHGCINMRVDDAEDVFNWAEVGTIVQVIP